MGFNFVRAGSSAALGAASGVLVPDEPGNAYVGVGALVGGAVVGSIAPWPLADVADGLADGGAALAGRGVAPISVGIAVAALAGLGLAVVVLAATRMG